MRILTPENKSIDMNDLPDMIDDSVKYCVLDYSNQNEVDFYFMPMIFREQVTIPAADLKIGPYRVQVPLDWSVMIADKDFGNVEIIDLVDLRDRPFEVFALNPVNGYIPEFHEITIENVFPNVSWTVPKLRNGHLLAVPLSGGERPVCAFFVRETNKLPEVLDIGKIFS